MKKVLAAVALVALAATAYAGTTPGTGVVGSKHDINLTSGLTADSQGRVCAFCHTPHHALSAGGQYAPLWSHNLTGLTLVTPYASATFDGDRNTAVDPLVGPSRLCMSCHDGVVAPDQHYGALFAGTSPTGRFANDSFGDIAVGKGGDFSNDHPIGFDVRDTLAYDSASATNHGIFNDIITSRTWTVAGVAGTRPISAGMYSPTAGGAERIMTCATCHDVHNKDNVPNSTANRLDAAHTDTVNGNYFVYAPQSGSQLCTSCHDK
jgi:hypothetical protein